MYSLPPTVIWCEAVTGLATSPIRQIPEFFNTLTNVFYLWAALPGLKARAEGT